MNAGRVPDPRAALYAQLGLVLAPLPETSCGGCPACTDRMPAPPDYYESGRHQNDERLAVIEAERAKRMEAVARRAQASTGALRPVAQWKVS